MRLSTARTGSVLCAPCALLCVLQLHPRSRQDIAIWLHPACWSGHIGANMCRIPSGAPVKPLLTPRRRDAASEHRAWPDAVISSWVVCSTGPITSLRLNCQRLKKGFLSPGQRWETDIRTSSAGSRCVRKRRDPRIHRQQARFLFLAETAGLAVVCPLRSVDAHFSTDPE